MRAVHVVTKEVVAVAEDVVAAVVVAAVVVAVVDVARKKAGVGLAV